MPKIPEDKKTPFKVRLTNNKQVTALCGCCASYPIDKDSFQDFMIISNQQVKGKIAKLFETPCPSCEFYRWTEDMSEKDFYERKM